MALISTGRLGERDSHSRKYGLEVRFILLVTFAFFLLAGVFERLLLWNWMTNRGSRNRLSLLQEAWESAGRCTTYAFMG